MYTFGIKKHPKILLMADKESSVWDSLAKNAKSVAKDAANVVLNSPLWEAGRKLKLSKEDNMLIEKVEKEVNDSKWKPIYTILKATGAISEDKASLAMRWATTRWDTNDGREWARELLNALEDFNKWNLTILTYSKEKWYQRENLSKYESMVNNDTSNMNAWVMRWLYSLKWTPMSFGDDTWGKIGLYLLDRSGESRLIKWWSTQDAQALLDIWNKEKDRKEENLQKIVQWVWNNPKMKEFLEKKWILIYGELNIHNELIKLKNEWKNIEGIEKHFEKLSKELLNEAKALLEESKKIAKESGLNTKSLADLKISGIQSVKDGKKIDISNKLFTELSLQESKDALIWVDLWISKLDKKSGEYKNQLQQGEQIKNILTLRIASFWKAVDAGKAKATAKKANEDAKKWITAKDFEAYSIKSQEVIGTLAYCRMHIDSLAQEVAKYGINTFEQAQIKLSELKNKWSLSEEEVKFSKLLKQYIDAVIDGAREHQSAVKILGKTQAEKMFTIANRFIGGNPSEKYDFRAIKKIAILKDPESTETQKALVSIKPGENLTINENNREQSAVTSLSEKFDIHISRDLDWTYTIPLVGKKHLTEDEAEEYIININLYTKLWLSQFIPHIPLITDELKRKWINTDMNGNTGTWEQQQVLKEIYSLLFGKKVETSNLEDVKRAFGSSLWTPENMKNAMQHTLKANHLIKESGQPISAEKLIKWMRSNDKPQINQNPLNMI